MFMDHMEILDQNVEPGEEEMDPIFEESMARALESWPGASDMGAFISFDLSVEENYLILQSYLPGLKYDELCISLSGYAVRIEGEFECEQLGPVDYSLLGKCRKFQRVIVFPQQINPCDVITAYEEDVFKLMVSRDCSKE